MTNPKCRRKITTLFSFIKLFNLIGSPLKLINCKLLKTDGMEFVFVPPTTALLAIFNRVDDKALLLMKLDTPCSSTSSRRSINMLCKGTFTSAVTQH